jgi:hypothetical protein
MLTDQLRNMIKNTPYSYYYRVHMLAWVCLIFLALAVPAIIHAELLSEAQ